MSLRKSLTRQIVTVTVTARSTREVPEDNGEDQPLLRSVASLKLVCDSGALTTARKEAQLQGGGRSCALPPDKSISCCWGYCRPSGLWGACQVAKQRQNKSSTRRISNSSSRTISSRQRQQRQDHQHQQGKQQQRQQQKQQQQPQHRQSAVGSSSSSNGRRSSEHERKRT